MSESCLQPPEGAAEQHACPLDVAFPVDQLAEVFVFTRPLGMCLFNVLFLIHARYLCDESRRSPKTSSSPPTSGC